MPQQVWKKDLQSKHFAKAGIGDWFEGIGDILSLWEVEFIQNFGNILIDIEADNKRLKEALQEIIKESGDVDIKNWPTKQQICQAIAQQALKDSNEQQP